MNRTEIVPVVEAYRETGELVLKRFLCYASSSDGPLSFSMYPVFGVRGATYFLGVSEWLFGALWFAGFWNKKLGVLGALGACGSFIATSTIIPFMDWAASAGGFPAMTEHVAFLMKDILFSQTSFYSLKPDGVRVWLSPQCGNYEANVEMSKGGYTADRQ